MTAFKLTTDKGMTIVVSASSAYEAENIAIKTGFVIVSVEVLL